MKPLKEVTVQGVKLSYRVAGQGSMKVLFIHGALGSSMAWVFQLRMAEEEGFEALAPDLPGHGGSSDLQGEVDIAYLAGLMKSFLEVLGVEEAVVVGHSMGGAIAMTLAAEAPRRVKGLALANTGAKLGVLPEILEGLSRDYRRTVEEVIAPMSFAYTVDKALLEASIAEMMKVPPHVAYRNFKACNAFDFRDRLSEVKVPTLILVGSEDKLTPVKWAEYLHKHIAGSRLVVVEGAGHASMLEKPKEFNEALRSFLRSLEGSK
ncbi:MAG: alpha/beta hydrolase [Thermoprotei archaeon]|nr:MAG: alpha/beta hydrolase [Thermoprotei archaeon]